jgi:hypothetical protein
MHELMSRANADIEAYPNDDKSKHALASIVHHGLVQAWDKPQANYTDHRLPKKLIEKHKAWLEARLAKTQERDMSQSLGRTWTKRK